MLLIPAEINISYPQIEMFYIEIVFNFNNHIDMEDKDLTVGSAQVLVSSKKTQNTKLSYGVSDNRDNEVKHK